MAASASPIREGERIFEVDVLRGFALFGILLVNMDGFAWPITETRLAWHASSSLVDQFAGWLIRFLAQGKFFTLFSLLFGLGLAMQMARAESRAVKFLPVYVRRLVALFGFGLLHINLLWAGDILTDYAILGCILLLFRSCRSVVLLRWSLAALALPMLLTTLWAWPISGSADVRSLPPMPADEERIEASAEGTAAAAQRHPAIAVYQRGSFAEMRALRLREVRELQLGGIVFEPIAFAMFLLGLAVGRARIPENISALAPRIRQLGVWAAALGVAANVVFVVFEDRAWAIPSSFNDWLSSMGFIVGGPVMMLGYAAGLTVLLQSPAWARRLAPLAAAGRMPLTNYLTQSVICTTIFYGYGLGLFGRIGLAAGVALSVAIFAIQVGYSSWWFRRFQFGPLEWVWRAATYGPWLGSRVPGREGR